MEISGVVEGWVERGGGGGEKERIGREKEEESAS